MQKPCSESDAEAFPYEEYRDAIAAESESRRTGDRKVGLLMEEKWQRIANVRNGV